ncbi:restriction endonuclease subunit S [Staphylococcus sp. IVB6238]|uniref:restriction endonuclease subunit S n=1 Tax=Staphylococcus sp. IVB6238 TaxID=2989770 RepID=UPI0021CEC48A|nr:restriction endonuclease subunit S [Staphylococcus sp. IVB6238]UXR73973.1 restriction endonuclease subunit S [Staphylococcus sp. IVB6238]
MSREMKDSGIEWIGKIPEDWEVVKLGVVADISTGNTPTDPDNIKYSKSEGVDWLKTNNLLGVDGVSNSSLKIKEQYISEARLTNPRSVLITCIGDIGKLGYTSKPVAFNQQINSITFTKDIVYWKYGMYALYSQREQQESFANGNVLKILNRENQKKVVITVPKDINKQIKISNALDKICLYIRKLVDKTQLSIKELKKYKQSLITEAVTKGLDSTVEMKDSGVEWIGDIPKHWNINKIKYNTSTIDTKKDFVKEDIYIGLENVLSYEGRINDYGKLVKDSKEKYFEKGNILYSKLRPYLAKAFIADITGSCSGEFIVFESFKGNKRYLLYWLISQLFTDFINATSYGAKMPRSSWDYIKETSIPRPPKREENEIVSYLDDKLSQINKLIENKTKIIKELETYKNSLIYEYVTGKKEV